MGDMFGPVNEYLAGLESKLSAQEAEISLLKADMARLLAPPPPQEPAGIILTPADNLQEAIADAGTTPIYLKSGTYAGEFVMQTGTQIYAYPDHAPVLTGAKVVNPSVWTKNGDYYYIPWSIPFYQHPAEQTRGGEAGIQHWRAMQPHLFIIDGKILKTVYTPGEMDPGSMYLEGTAASPKRIWIRLKDGQTPADVQILAATTQRIISAAPGTEGVQLGGLTLRYCANTGYQGSLHIPEKAAGWVLRDIDTRFSNTEGLHIEGNGHTFERVRSLYHGQSGISTEGMNASTLSDIETSYNNWKGFDQKWDAGNKFRRSNGNTITNLLARLNPIWWDINNTGNTTTRFEITDSICWGLHVEWGSKYNTFTDGAITGTRKYQDIPDTGNNLHIQGNISGCRFENITLENAGNADVWYKKKETRNGVVNYSGNNTFSGLEMSPGSRFVIEGDPMHLPDAFEGMEKPAFVVYPR